MSKISAEDYYEFHESKESLMDDGHRDECDICGAVIDLNTCHDFDGFNLCDECYDQKNEEDAEEDEEDEEDEEPEEPEEA